MRDFEDPATLLAWWESHASSAFRDRVIFFVLSPVSVGSAERFFSMCGEIDEDQWALCNDTRRLQFMIQAGQPTIEPFDSFRCITALSFPAIQGKKFAYLCYRSIARCPDSSIMAMLRVALPR